MSSNSQLPIGRVRVLSFGMALAGNLTAMALAELGADVIKIESPQQPDGQRDYYFPDHPRTFEPGGASTTGLFNGIARSTRGITLDMRSDEGREEFAALVAESDVVLENFRPGVLDRWGFGFDALKALNPTIVVVSMSGFGATAPRDGYVCYGTTSAAFTGLAYRTDAIVASHQDDLGAVHGAVAVLGALAYRDATGEAVWIDQSQSDAGAAAMGASYLDAIINGDQDERAFAFGAGSLLHGIFECAGGGWIAVEAEDLDQWQRLLALLAADKVDVDPAAPPQGESAQRDLVAEWLLGQRAFRALRRLTQAGVPAGVVQHPDDIYRDPQLRQRGFIVEVVHPDLGTIEYPAPPYRLSRTPARIVGPAPRLGQHNDEILEGLALAKHDPATP